MRSHSCGDRSCREAINAYENALKKFPETESRHMVEHLELVDPNDIPRFGQLGIICSIQPEHLAGRHYEVGRKLLSGKTWAGA